MEKKQKTKNKFRFSTFGFSHRPYRESAVTVALKTHFKYFRKGIFVQEGSSGTHFNHDQFEIKTFAIEVPLTEGTMHLLHCEVGHVGVAEEYPHSYSNLQ